MNPEKFETLNPGNWRPIPRYENLITFMKKIVNKTLCWFIGHKVIVVDQHDIGGLSLYCLQCKRCKRYYETESK